MGLADSDPGWDYSIDPESLKGLGPAFARTFEDPDRLEMMMEKIRTGLAEAAILP